MITHDRHQLLLSRLGETGSIQVAGLAELLGVTPMTIWRDLRLLEEQGLLRRVRGGAILADSTGEPEFRHKVQHASAEKQRIAAFAARNHVRDGDTIIVEGGTTVACIMDHLQHNRLGLMTNSLPILTRAYEIGKPWHIHASGGVLSPVSGNLVGPEAVAFFAGKHAQIFFMSATGLDPETGALTDPNPVEIEVKRAMAASAKHVVLLLDSSKLGIRSTQQVLPLKNIEVLITDKKIDRKHLKTLRANGLRVETC